MGTRRCGSESPHKSQIERGTSSLTLNPTNFPSIVSARNYEASACSRLLVASEITSFSVIST
jgi:hypothetical protein